MLNTLSTLFKTGLPKGVEFIAAADARDALKAGEFGLVLDVRAPEEWSRARIPGALLAPMSGFNAMREDLASRKGESVLVYCHTHNRSSRASWALHEMGFGNLKVLRDGISGWAKAGYELES